VAGEHESRARVFSCRPRATRSGTARRTTWQRRERGRDGGAGGGSEVVVEGATESAGFGCIGLDLGISEEEDPY
jgi:hypothetical protein